MVVKYHFRLYLFSLLILGAFSTLVYRLYYLQIERSAEFISKLPGSKDLKVRVPGVRGEIKDRNGITLVSNKPAFEVRINLADVVQEKIRREEQKMSAAERAKGKGVKLPKHRYEVVDKGIRREVFETDIEAILDELVFQPLDAMQLSKDYDLNQLRVHYRTFKSTVPWVYRSDLSFEEFSKFAEHNFGLPGVSVGVRPIRQYLYDSLACHMLGYVRLPDDQQVPEEERKKWDFYVGDDYGWAGLEKTMDSKLRGIPGVRTMRKNSKGAMVGEVDYQEPKKGNDVWLTLDARIQMITEKALRDANIGRGASVVIDPNSGEVLAMASVPNYNPNKFIPTISKKDYQELLDNPVIPLLHRAVRPFAPGSTFKIVTAFAGCLAGIDKYHFNCSGSVTYGNKAMQCWIQRQFGGSHGNLDLSEAIMRSCNCYFYQYGNRAGITAIGRAGHMLGVGERTGIELLDEDPGVLPSKEWMQLNMPNENWRSPGLIANTSIGQGFDLATPLQMCSVVATVANAGKSFKPHLLKKVTNGDQIVEEDPPAVRTDLAAEGVTRDQIELIRRGMWKVVNAPEGTAKAARIPGIEVAGKTGTAQFWRISNGEKKPDNHTWFMCFAPYEAPKYAVIVLVQGGKSGGGTSAPIAHRIMEQSLALEQGLQVPITALPEVVGHLHQIEGVQYADSGIALPATPVDDPDAGASDPNEVRMAPEEKVKAEAVADANMIRNVTERSKSKRSSAPKAVPVPEAKPVAAPEKKERSGGLLRSLFR
jgi:penicillin-binding protein 2